MWLRLRHSGTAQEGNTAGVLTGAMLCPWVESFSLMRELRIESLCSGFQNIQILWPKNSTSGNIPSGKSIAAEKALCTKMFNTVLFTKAKQQPKCPIIGGWLSDLGYYSHLMEEWWKWGLQRICNNGKKCLCYITDTKFIRQDSEL